MTYAEELIEPGKILLKDKILKAGIKLHQRLKEEYQLRIDELVAVKSEQKEEHENHLQSFRSEMMSEVRLLSDQLHVVSRELEELRQIRNYDCEVHPYVEYGTVVETDKAIFFIFADVKKFRVDELDIIGLPVQSNVYKAMKGKAPGDSFIYSGATHWIKEIF